MRVRNVEKVLFLRQFLSGRSVRLLFVPISLIFLLSSVVSSSAPTFFLNLSPSVSAFLQGNNPDDTHLKFENDRTCLQTTILVSILPKIKF